MTEKSYSQMEQEFYELYNKEIKPKLPEYAKMHKFGAMNQLSFPVCFFSFFIMMICGIAAGSENNLPKLPFVIGLVISIITFLIFMFISQILCLINPENRAFIEKDEENENISYIKAFDLEMDLKETLMPKVVNIFFENANWHKTYTSNQWSSEERKYHIKDLRSFKILNTYPWARYDDIIYGSYKNVGIKIHEVNTKIIILQEFIPILMLSIFIGVPLYLSMNKMLLVPLILLLILVLIFCLIKLPRYSLFKGVIVEFDINKNFKGHTFFHENSFLAKKISFDKNYYKKVNLESVTFENKYNVYSDDQIESRYIFTPSLMERIENLKFAFKAKYVRGSFKDKKLLLAVHTGKDMFAMGSDFEDSDSNTFKMLCNEMLSILQIVDELKINEHTGL